MHAGTRSGIPPLGKEPSYGPTGGGGHAHVGGVQGRLERLSVGGGGGAHHSGGYYSSDDDEVMGEGVEGMGSCTSE